MRRRLLRALHLGIACCASAQPTLLRQLGLAQSKRNTRLVVATLEVVDCHARIDVARRTWVGRSTEERLIREATAYVNGAE